LWDFGTMRHVGGGGTVGRVAAPPVAAPILEEEAYGHQPESRNGSSHPGGNSNPYSHNANGYSSSSTLTNLKTELPPVPQSVPAHVGSTPNKALPTPTPSPTKANRYADDDEEGTVRRMAERREASYGSDGSEELRLDLERATLASPVPPTMLDSVVLPAIASVRAGSIPFTIYHSDANVVFPQLFPRVSTADARLALTNLRAAFIEAEKKIPGVTDEIVNEVVDSVEHVEDL
jgi:serine/threonine-protein kinase 24/25/MST4